jgi:glycosyltransferase involved in cell wall biosynthesis
VSAPLVSVVVPLRDRAGVRLSNCLASLRWQQSPPRDDVEIVLSDYGSAEPFRTDVAALASAHGAAHRYTDARGLWNRSAALNCGIRAAHGRWVLCTDSDMIFAPNFLATLLAVQAEHDERALCLCRSSDLPPGAAEGAVAEADLPALRGRAALRPTYGKGGCQFARRSWFEDVRGYDEGYQWWGWEDLDMAHRAQRSGLVWVWVEERTWMLHQWHRKLNDRHYLKIWGNRWRYWTTRHRVVKNLDRWGEGR